MIWDKLDESMIQIGVSAATADEMLRVVGDRLVEGGYANPGYSDGLIEREHKFPTGLYIDGFGIAIPHADSSFARRTTIAVALPCAPVPFADMAQPGATVDASAVFCLCLATSHAHVEELQCLMGLLQDADFRTALLQSTTPHQVIDCVRRAELNNLDRTTSLT